MDCFGNNLQITLPQTVGLKGIFLCVQLVVSWLFFGHHLLPLFAYAYESYLQLINYILTMLVDGATSTWSWLLESCFHLLLRYCCIACNSIQLSHRYSFFYLFLNQFEEDGHLVQFASFTGPSVCCDKSECMLRQMVTQLIFSSIWYWNISSLNHIIWHSF